MFQLKKSRSIRHSKAQTKLTAIGRGKKPAYLVGDIGGTNCRIAAYDTNLNQIARTITPSHHIQSLPAHIKAFMESPQLTQYSFKNSVFGVAGPVSADKTFCKFTNINWILDANILQRELKLESVLLMNDFVATSAAVEKVPIFKKVLLSDTGQLKHGVLNDNIEVVLGPGTGLGVCLRIRNDKGQFISNPSECSAAPLFLNNPSLVSLAKFMVRKNISLTNEEILSGRGIALLYKFAYGRAFLHRRLRAKYRRIQDSHDQAAAVTTAAIEHNDPIAHEAVRMFVETLASVAQGLALTTLCSRIYIAGGISPRIQYEIEKQFMHHFTRHNDHKFKDILSNIEVILVTEPDVGLLGAAILLQRSL